MKPLLLTLLLLASAAGAADTGEVAAPDLLSPTPLGPETTFTSPSQETVTFNGREYPKYVDPNVFGPLLPGQEFGTPPANAFNAAATLSPDGTPWANPSCNFIPCRTAGSDQTQKEADMRRQPGQPGLQGGRRPDRPVGDDAPGCAAADVRRGGCTPGPLTAGMPAATAALRACQLNGAW